MASSGVEQVMDTNCSVIAPSVGVVVISDVRRRLVLGSDLSRSKICLAKGWISKRERGAQLQKAEV